MTKIKPITADGNEPRGYKQLESHVQGQPPLYGEPNGPTPGTLFEGTPREPVPDREVRGFVGGKAVASKGDQVGSGPEEWERQSRDLSGEDRK